MPLQIHKFEVFILPDGADPETAEPEGHEVRILHIDQLMAERALHRSGIPLDLAVHVTDAWAYAACQRLGHYPKDRPLALWLERDCMGVQKPTEEEATEEVDPTPKGPLTT